MIENKKVDAFTNAYLDCALWSSSGPKFGKCPVCGRLALLDRWPEPEFSQEAMCSAAGCGVREMDFEPALSECYGWADIEDGALARMLADCARFQAEAGDNLAGYPLEHAGHDFWLTRNGHGAGFWEVDFGTDETCAALTALAKEFGACDLSPGDDGKLYLIGGRQ